MRVAARLAYWGPAYHGYARQPDVDTVEGDLVRALREIRAIRDPKSARLGIASRTDRGVSAVANVVAFDTSLPPAKLPAATSGRMHDAWLWSAIRVPDTFNPRHVRSRTYRYHLPGEVPTKGLRAAAALFVGEHDFAAFAVDRVGGPLTLARIRVRRDAPFVAVDFHAERFARGLLRRIAGAMVAYAHAEVTRSDLLAALHGGHLRTAPAEPEGLFLIDVDCGLEWPAAPGRASEAIRNRLHRAELARRFHDGLARQARGSPTSRWPRAARSGRPPP